MKRTSILSCLVIVCSLFSVAPLQAELSSFDKWRLEDAKREWDNVRRQDFDFRVRQNDHKIRDALRRGEEGDPFWETDFDRLMEDRRRTKQNLEAIKDAYDVWDSERRRGSNNLTDPIDFRIRDTLNNAEYDDNGFWRDDFNRQLRQRREIRRDSEFRPTPIHDLPSPPFHSPNYNAPFAPFNSDWIDTIY